MNISLIIRSHLNTYPKWLFVNKLKITIFKINHFIFELNITIKKPIEEVSSIKYLELIVDENVND